MSTLIARPFESPMTSEPTPAWSNVVTRESQAGWLPLATGTWVHRVIQPRSCITLEDNSNPGSLRQTFISSHASFEKRYRYIGITSKEKATIWDWCYLLELSIKRSIRLSIRIPIFFASIRRFFDTSSAELISTFVPVHSTECRNEVLLSTTS